VCVIVDINIAGRVLLAEDDPDFAHLHRCLFTNTRPQVRLVYGGKLVEEYNRVAMFRQAIVHLDRAGRARRIDDLLIEREVELLVRARACRSNDVHIVALARVAGARVLCSDDRDLHADFTDPRLLSHPRGKIYRNARHRGLLRQPCG